MQTQEILKYISNGVDYLIRLQNRDGSWIDYQLPVGESDQWVTAFTGLGVARAAKVLKSKTAYLAAEHALEFLIDRQEYDAGWGYNSKTGVDADSTAYVIELFKALDKPVPCEDVLCLLDHFCVDGGVSTYRENSGWGMSHPDVTATAALALSEYELKQFKHSLTTYCRSSYIPDIGWPSYWWRNHLYSTWHILELHERLGIKIPSMAASVSVAIESAFDLAWAIGILKKLSFSDEIITKPLSILCDLQEASGKWPGAANLRVTDPDCYEPWISAKGNYYVDNYGTITTASVLTVLCQLVGLNN